MACNCEQSNSECCINCRFYQERTGFCRYNPPNSVQTFVKGIGEMITSVWPKVPMPTLDYCSHFEQKTSDKQLLND